MRTVGSYEAKTRLPALLEEVEAGATVVITRHGVPVARMVPIEEAITEPEAVIAELLEFRQGIARGDMSIKQMMNEGRRS